MSKVVSSNFLITNNSLRFYSCNKLPHELLLLQKKIYKAAIFYDYKRVHQLQKSLLSSNLSELVSIFRILEKYLKISNKKTNNTNKHNKCNNSISRTTDEKQLLNLLISQIVITDLNHKINQYLVYLCLKPEWEAKFNVSNFQYTINTSYINKLKLISNICRQYNKSTNKNYIYILQGNIDTYETLQHFNYFKQKLHSITEINQLITRCCKLPLNTSSNDSNSVLPELTYLLINIIMEDLGTYVHVTQKSCINVKNKNNNRNLLQKFIWHNNNFIFISNSKNEIVLVKSQINKFYNAIGLYKSIKKTQISKLHQGFNFIGFHITNYCKSADYPSLVTIQPSLESQLMLIKKIKSILYHKDKFHRNRANAYLPTKLAIARIISAIQQWKKYYCDNDLVNKISLKKLNSIMQEVIYRWEIKKHRKKSKLKHKYRINHILTIY